MVISSFSEKYKLKSTVKREWVGNIGGQKTDEKELNGLLGECGKFAYRKH